MDYKSSLNEMDRFIGSHVYDDMTKDFEDWLEGAREKLEISDDPKDFYRQQGAVQVMKDVLQWAENFRDLLEEQTNDNR